jgi:hypothetical protein
MAWSTPLTAVSNATLTAAQWNASVRDNLAETAPAKATTAGSIFAGTGANSIAERIPSGDTVGTSQTTTSTSYVDLATVGPSVTVTTGVLAFVFVSCQMTNNTGTIGSFMSFTVSGATTVAATDGSSLVHYPTTAGLPMQATRAVSQGLTAGSNTFTAKYRAAANTGTFSQRGLAVIPF